MLTYCQKMTETFTHVQTTQDICQSASINLNTNFLMLVSFLMKTKYKCQICEFSEIFGGAAAMTPEQLTKVNGFSNQYWGWGGEDDDMFKRIDANKFKIIREGFIRKKKKS